MAVAVGDSSVETRQAPMLTSRGFRVFALSLLLLAVTIVSLGLGDQDRLFSSPDLLLWSAAVAAANLFPIRANTGAHLTLDMPLLLAAGLVLGPIAAGLIALVATLDREEWRTAGFLWVGLANRAQTALCVIAGAAVFQALGGSHWQWPQVGVVAAAAVGTDILVNYALVSFGNAIRLRQSPLLVVRKLALGTPNTFALAYVSFGFLSVLLAELVRGIGTPAVALVFAPLVLAYQSFGLRAKLQLTQDRLSTQARALVETSRRMADERREERLALAGELHDEVLPPLFKVHLMGQVLRQDLASGRLLALDDDVPELLSATEAAQGAVRGVVSDLRRSPLGAAGLNATVRLLAGQLESSNGPRYELVLCADSWPRMAQLLIYQVAREAMHNAARHSRGSLVRVETREEGGRARIIVEDDGVGFASSSMVPPDHFGLQLIRERVLAVGGDVAIESGLGEGTRVVASVPINPEY